MFGFMPAPPGISWNNSPSGFSSSVMNVRSSAETLRNTIRGMIGAGRGTSSPFGALTPTSANTDALAITGFDANRLRNSNPTGFTVDVTQVARAQVNRGMSFASSDLARDTGFAVGQNQLSVQIGSQQFDFNFTVSETDTNQDVQQRIASAINSRNIGVTASVSTDSSQGTSALVIQSRQTGVASAGLPNFTVSGSGATSTGVGNITQTAQNAEFRVNRSGFTGALQTSRSNDVDLGFGISGQIREVGRTQVNMVRDTQGQFDSIRDMVSSFNSFIRVARENTNGARPNRLEQQLMGLSSAYAAGLNRVGITANRDGTLQVDERRLRAAAEDGSLARFVGDGAGGAGNTGFINRLERTVDNAIRNPGTLLNNVGNTNVTASSNRQFMQMTRLMQTGMLFNAWF
jgi:flagellar hook-associated protein 2